MTTVEQPVRLDGARAAASAVVDCDVHHLLRSLSDLKKRLPQRFHVYLDTLPGLSFGGVTIGARPGGIYRGDSVPRGGGPPGSDLGLVREQLLERFGITHAVLNSVEWLAWQTTQYGAFPEAATSAMNDFTAEEWLAEDPRFYASICIPVEDGNASAREIERMAGVGRFVAVLMPALTREPLGHPKYWPIYEAAAAQGLAVLVHVGGWSGTFSGVGWPTFWLESHMNIPQTLPAQITSLLYNSVPDRFDVQFVLAEGGIGWAPSLMWRLDRAWEAMRDQVPHMERRPSDVVRSHFAFTTQPFDEPEKTAHLADLFDQLDMDDRVLLATDYPHWDFDDPMRVLPASAIGVERRRKILGANALALLPFDAAR
jgi:predicted TIM-barrel fold metal-dependent hydrolase